MHVGISRLFELGVSREQRVAQRRQLRAIWQFVVHNREHLFDLGLQRNHGRRDHDMLPLALTGYQPIG